MIDPTSRLREGLNPRRCTEITTKAGIVLLIVPCLITPREVLSGRMTPHQCAVLELRNAWARAELSGGNAATDAHLWAQVALGAVQASYDVSREEINDWLTDDDMQTIALIAAAACGRTSPLLADQRRRAINVAALGLADVPITPNEMAALSDFAVNSGRAPGTG